MWLPVMEDSPVDRQLPWATFCALRAASGYLGAFYLYGLTIEGELYWFGYNSPDVSPPSGATPTRKLPPRRMWRIKPRSLATAVTNIGSNFSSGIFSSFIPCVTKDGAAHLIDAFAFATRMNDEYQRLISHDLDRVLHVDLPSNVKADYFTIMPTDDGDMFLVVDWDGNTWLRGGPSSAAAAQYGYSKFWLSPSFSLYTSDWIKLTTGVCDVKANFFDSSYLASSPPPTVVVSPPSGGGRTAQIKVDWESRNSFGEQVWSPMRLQVVDPGSGYSYSPQVRMSRSPSRGRMPSFNCQVFDSTPQQHVSASQAESPAYAAGFTGTTGFQESVLCNDGFLRKFFIPWAMRYNSTPPSGSAGVRTNVGGTAAALIRFGEYSIIVDRSSSDSVNRIYDSVFLARNVMQDVFAKESVNLVGWSGAVAFRSVASGVRDGRVSVYGTTSSAELWEFRNNALSRLLPANSVYSVTSCLGGFAGLSPRGELLTWGDVPAVYGDGSSATRSVPAETASEGAGSYDFRRYPRWTFCRGWPGRGVFAAIRRDERGLSFGDRLIRRNPYDDDLYDYLLPDSYFR